MLPARLVSLLPLSGQSSRIVLSSALRTQTCALASQRCAKPRRLSGPLGSLPVACLPSNARPLSTKTIYHGPLAKTGKYLKRFSVTSLVGTCVLAPLILIVDSGLAMDVRVALATTAAATSGLSTGLVFWALKPYVLSLAVVTSDDKDHSDAQATIAPNSSHQETAPGASTASEALIQAPICVRPESMLQIKSMDFLGRAVTHSVLVRDLARSNRVFTTWKVARQSTLDDSSPKVAQHAQTSYAPVNAMFYVHEEVQHFPEMTTIVNLVSGKEESLRNRAAALRAAREEK
ncbi:hypothetical protein H4R34_004120 [Dimargaris verticillata]|uniref:Transmembrane protein n=1 Tax=Dimargaris verticillata TaxID=2761393 RepID=A0A9W8E7J8_9FUNG|nr:hypothetical protein H4R34_004120 [Dimargaris verticillata]